jgi:hypothetical protein
MKPGDLIEWVYKYNSSTVSSDEFLWSSTMKDHVPIGGINLLVLVDENKITWVNDKGLFHARVDDVALEAGRRARPQLFHAHLDDVSSCKVNPEQDRIRP